MLLLKIAPEHLDKEVFLAILEYITSSRIDAKALASLLSKKGILTPDEGKQLKEAKTKAEGLKIVINVIYGKLKDENSVLYDPKATYTVTINGELRIMSLVEDFTLAGFQVISANTDGVTVILKPERLSDYNNICNNWMAATNFGLEITEYTTYIRRNVNNYIAVKPNGEIKRKGSLETKQDIKKGFKTLIIPIAVEEYFLNGVPVDETLKKYTNPKDIYLFCYSQNTGREFKIQYHTLNKTTYREEITTLQKNNRYYVSNTGGTLFKKYPSNHPSKANRKIGICARQYVTIINKEFPITDFKDYNVKYNWYKTEIYKIIDEINNVITKKIKGTGKGKGNSSGGLFDFDDLIK